MADNVPTVPDTIKVTGSISETVWSLIHVKVVDPEKDIEEEGGVAPPVNCVNVSEKVLFKVFPY